MNRTPTRTDLVEDLARRVKEKRDLALDARTAARAYSDIADAIEALPPQGPLYVQACTELASHARGEFMAMVDNSVRLAKEADNMEAQGVPS